MRKINYRKKTRGLTLIEIVITTAVVGIIVAVSSMYIVEVIRLWNFMFFRNEVVSQARISLMRMTREIRQVYNQSSILSAEISRFYFNINNTTSIDYNIVGNNLMRNNDTLATGITNLTFVYYNNTSTSGGIPTPVADTSQIYLINITLEVESGTQKKLLRAYVFPRNLGG